MTFVQKMLTVRYDERGNAYEGFVFLATRTFATNMQRLPLKTLQSVLGHGDVRTTMTHYVDPSPSAQQLAEINAVASAIC